MFSVIISIIAGAAGYLIVTFIFRPILRLRTIRFQVASDLEFYANAINDDGLNEEMKKRVNDRRVSNRRHSADLAAIYYELPSRYKRYLERRGMRIQKAAQALMTLSNTFDFEPANVQIDNIRRWLQIISYE